MVTKWHVHHAYARMAGTSSYNNRCNNMASIMVKKHSRASTNNTNVMD